MEEDPWLSFKHFALGIFFLLSAGSNCVCEAVAHYYVGLEIAIITKPVPNYYFNVRLLDKIIKRHKLKSLKLQMLAKYHRFPAVSVCFSMVYLQWNLKVQLSVASLEESHHIGLKN